MISWIKRYWLWLGLGVLGTGLVVVVGGLFWRAHSRQADLDRKYRLAQEFLSEGKPQDTLAVLPANRPRGTGPQAQRWRVLEIQALARAGQLGRILSEYERNPQDFLQDEIASLVLARALLTKKKTGPYQKVRKAWSDPNKVKDPASWLALDVDALLLEGKRDQAIALLKKHSFAPKEDVGRLLRLAMLVSESDPKESWGYLEQAYLKDSTRADLRLFRGQVLEAMGHVALARVEYAAAVALDTSDPRARDQLAEFYRRTDNLALAEQVWTENLGPDSPGFQWLKAWFWGRVAWPPTQPLPAPPTASNPYRPLLKYLQGIPPNQFWDSDAYQVVLGRDAYLGHRQEVYWLRLLQALKDNRLDEARQLIVGSPFKEVSWAPRLERSVLAVLRFRADGRWPKGELLLDRKSVGPPADAWLMDAIDARLAVSPQPNDKVSSQVGKTTRFVSSNDAENSEKKGASDQEPGKLDGDLGKKSDEESAKVKPVDDKALDALAKSNEVFSVLVLGQGWYNAGLMLHEGQKLEPSFPDNVAHGLARTLWRIRGAKAALRFLKSEPKRPDLELVRAEIQLGEGQIEQARGLLQELAGQKGTVGFRAGWLLATMYLEKDQFDKVEAVLKEQPKLAEHPLGISLKARIALAKKKVDEADKLFGQIRGRLFEADIYLARRAYEKGDYQTARTITLELLRTQPEQITLRNNLQRINQAIADQAKKKQGAR